MKTNSKKLLATVSEDFVLNQSIALDLQNTKEISTKYQIFVPAKYFRKHETCCFVNLHVKIEVWLNTYISITDNN